MGRDNEVCSPRPGRSGRRRSAQQNRVDCSIRRGLRECRALGADCHQDQVTNDAGQSVLRITFPMKEHEIEFPCSTPFTKPPIIMSTVESTTASSKLYANSLRKVGESTFSVNVQRVDDVENPDMSCHDIKLCYIAVVM